jgi:hypothetical protein
MSNPAIDLHCDQPDPAMHPQTFGEACRFIDQLLRGSLQGSYIPYIIGSTTPTVQDQDKLWFRLDNSGRPLGLFYYYSGSWRRQNTGLAGEVRMFQGNPSSYFDGTGKGILGTEWDGWALCNGNNGTSNLTDRFIVTAHMDGSGGISMYSSGWQTGVTGSATKTGGQKNVTLIKAQIPLDPSDAVLLDKFTADGNARSNSGLLLGHHSGTHDPDGSEAIIPADSGNTTPDPVWILPPYIAFGFATFIGY